MSIIKCINGEKEYQYNSPGYPKAFKKIDGKLIKIKCFSQDYCSWCSQMHYHFHGIINREKYKDKRREYALTNLDKQRLRSKRYRLNNKDKLRKYQREYRKKNIERIRKRDKLYKRKSYKKKMHGRNVEAN